MKPESTSHRPYVICGPTALDFWERHGRACLIEPTRGAITWAHDLERRLDDQVPRSGRAGRPIHLLIDDKRKVRSNLTRVHHLYSGPMPDNGLVRVTPGVIVTSPEMSIATLGRHMSDCPSMPGEAGPRAVELATMRTCMRVCGTQSAAPKCDQGPLTNASRLRDTVAQLKYAQGLPLLRKVLPYVADGAPDNETIWLYQLFCLPYRYGSLGLPQASVSPRDCPLVRSSDQQVKSYGLSWPKTRVALVVTDTEHPLTVATMGQMSWFDTIGEEGWKVLYATSPCLGNTQTVFSIASRLSSLMGYNDLRRRCIKIDLLQELIDAAPLPVRLQVPIQASRAGSAMTSTPEVQASATAWDEILEDLA